MRLLPMHRQQVARDSPEAGGDCIQLDLLEGAVGERVHHVVGPKQSHCDIGLEEGNGIVCVISGWALMDGWLDGWRTVYKS